MPVPLTGIPAGIVYQNIDRAPSLYNGFICCRDLVRTGHVGRDNDRGLPDLRCRFGQRVHAPPSQRDPRTRHRKADGHGPPNTAAGTGDPNDAVLQVWHVTHLLASV
jgi:hypothetical protein